MKLGTISLAEALQAMDACQEEAEKYEGLTLEQAWQSEEKEDRLNWLLSALYYRGQISQRMWTMLRNAGNRGVIKCTSTRSYYYDEYCFNEARCVAAIKATISVRTVRYAINRHLKKDGLVLEK